MNSELLLVVIPSTLAVLGDFSRLVSPSSYRTALEAAVEISEPFVGTARIRDAPGASPTRSSFVRVGVANLGKSAAWRVSILLTRLEKYNEEAPRYEVEEWFVPVEFAWCHGIGSQLQALNPHRTIYFDLGCYARAEFTGDTRDDFDSPAAPPFLLKRSRIDARNGAISSPRVNTNSEFK
jgi:hypothetical protein